MVSPNFSNPAPEPERSTPQAPAASAPFSPLADEELDAVQLAASKLHVYQVALELHTLCSVLLAFTHRVVRDQLEVGLCKACSKGLCSACAAIEPFHSNGPSST